MGSLIVVDRRVLQALADELHVLTDGHDAYTGVSLTATVDGTGSLWLRSLSNSTGELEGLLGGVPVPAPVSGGMARRPGT